MQESMKPNGPTRGLMRVGKRGGEGRSPHASKSVCTYTYSFSTERNSVNSDYFVQAVQHLPKATLSLRQKLAKQILNGLADCYIFLEITLESW